MRLVGFIIRIYHDARSPERQIPLKGLRDAYLLLGLPREFANPRSTNPGCSPDTTPTYPHLTSNLQQTKNERTNVVINIIVVSS